MHLGAAELSKPPPHRTMSLLCFPQEWGEVLGDCRGSCGGILGQGRGLEKEERSSGFVFFVFFFLGRVGRLWSVEGLCVVGTPDLPRSIPPPPSNLFWLQKRPKQQNCHLQCRSCPWGRKKEVGNQWSCINLLTANVLHILILDPFPAVPQANRHCPSRAPPFLTPLHTGAQAKMPH